MILVLIYENDGFHEKHVTFEQMLNSYLFVIRNMPVFNECSFYKDLSLTELLAYVFECFPFLSPGSKDVPGA